ncbi:conserved Plasmodium membrane protein, unknown function [Plasmodium sp. gorilla clade G2]|uniref:conserved Plasmodium membrane protein, unknown function n=1 Tax=Plasmodium sp. gorilla clade G2 TaxID=880535 RepID=UPI000D202BA1|nr:conserved Plasmodium membrane protein, unknown function [Plasmodium sp. gorilla clade G2]SOV10620.1 conserved Plasmodium membrane protein, unknown function [Plasmodium sp. gorilla clade G2]
MITKILNGWRISFFLNLVIFLAQQLGLYYILFEYNKLILLLCLFDIYIFLHFFFNNSQLFSAVKGGKCWVLYVYSISIKVIFMYFFAFNDDFFLADMTKDYYNKCLIFILLNLSTLIYTALSIKSYKQLYQDDITISNEKLFHNDLILHVVIDLFDMFELLFTLVKLSYIIKNTNFWIKIMGGVLISFSLYLNAYSFPIISIVREKNNKNLDLGDIYFCKKHAAMIGIILVDIPFMILRFYFLAFFFSNVHFQPLLIKNICFIPIKCKAIKNCNLIFQQMKKNIHHSENHRNNKYINSQQTRNYDTYFENADKKKNIPLLKNNSFLYNNNAFLSFSGALRNSLEMRSISSIRNEINKNRASKGDANKEMGHNINGGTQTRHSQKKYSQTSDIQTKYSQTSDSQTKYSQSNDSQTSDSQTSDSQTRNSQTRNSQTRNSQTRNSQTKYSQTRNSQTRNSQTRDSQTKYSQTNDHQNNDNQIHYNNITNDNLLNNKDFLEINKCYDNKLLRASNNSNTHNNDDIKKMIESNTTKHEEDRNNTMLDINEYNNNSNDLNEYFDSLIENNILAYRKINIKKNKIGTKFIMNKLMYTNVSNNERYRYYLDDNLKVSYINQLRLMIPYITYCLGKIAMSIVFYIFYIKFDISYLKLILTDYKMYFKLFEPKNIIFIVSFSIILGNTIISFFSFIFLSSFFEVLLSTLFIFIKCISEFLFLLLLVYNEVFEIFLRNIKQPDKYASYFFLTFSVIPSFKIIANIYFFLCALSGRQFIAYIIRPFIKEKNLSKLPNFFNLKEYNNNHNSNNNNNNNNIFSHNMNYLNEDYYLFNNNEMHTKNTVKGDYKGFISIASLLIYINTKYMHGLASLSTLMLGNNFVKNLRLNYNLRNNHILLLFINFFTRLSLLLFVYVHYKTSDQLYEYVEYFYYVVTFIFILDFILKCIYMFISHNLRLCAAYHLELKSIYEDIYYHSQIKKESSKIYLKHLYNKYQTNNFYYYNIPLFSEFL